MPIARLGFTIVQVPQDFKQGEYVLIQDGQIIGVLKPHLFSERSEIEPETKDRAQKKRERNRKYRAAKRAEEKGYKNNSSKPHPLNTLIFKPNRHVNIDESIEAIGRTRDEIMGKSWPSTSAEYRVKMAVHRQGKSLKNNMNG